MRFRDQLALTLPSLILRLTLCLIFLYAGLGKLLGETTVTGDDARRLVAMGVHLSPSTPTNPPAAAPAPTRPLPPETSTPPTELIIPDQPDPTTDSTITEPETPTSGIDTNAPPTTMASAMAAPRWLPVQHTPTAADFTANSTVQRVYGIALLLSKAGDPGLTPDSRPIPRTMPAWVAADRWPVYLAWAAAGTEILAAAMLFFGVLTRFGAVLIIGIMLQAMWLTQIGPAVVGRVDAYLGFIPAIGDPWSPATYQTLFYQIACLAMAKAVFFLGSGPIGFDRALFRAPERLERPSTAPKKRSTFDRQPTDTP